MTPGGDHVARVDAEQVEACVRDKLKLKAIILHDGHEEVHMTQPDKFAAADTVTGT